MDRLNRYLLLALLAIYIVTGFMARPESDDYCVAAFMAGNGGQQFDPLHYTLAIYNHWNGRFSQVFLQSTLAIAEPLASMLIPGLLIIAAVLLLRKLVNPLMALALPAALLTAMPGDNNTLYWLSSSMTYIAPVVVMLAGLVVLRGTRYTVPLLFGLGFVAGGFSESTTLMLALVWLALTGWQRRSWAFTVGLAVAFAIVYAAPGNAVRGAYFPEPSLNGAFYSAWDWWLTGGGIPVGALGWLLAFIAGVAYPAQWTQRRFWWAWWGLAALVTFGTMFAVGYGAGWSYRPGRVLVLAYGVWAVAWYLTGSALAGKRKRAIGRGLLALVTCAAMVVPLMGLPDMMRYSVEWDSRDALIRSGQTTVPALDSGRHTLSTMDSYVNICAAKWYGANEIVVK